MPSQRALLSGSENLKNDQQRIDTARQLSMTAEILPSTARNRWSALWTILTAPVKQGNRTAQSYYQIDQSMWSHTKAGQEGIEYNTTMSCPGFSLISKSHSIKVSKFFSQSLESSDGGKPQMLTVLVAPIQRCYCPKGVTTVEWQWRYSSLLNVWRTKWLSRVMEQEGIIHLKMHMTLLAGVGNTSIRKTGSILSTFWHHHCRCDVFSFPTHHTSDCIIFFFLWIIVKLQHQSTPWFGCTGGRRSLVISEYKVLINCNVIYSENSTDWQTLYQFASASRVDIPRSAHYEFLEPCGQEWLEARYRDVRHRWRRSQWKSWIRRSG